VHVAAPVLGEHLLGEHALQRAELNLQFHRACRAGAQQQNEECANSTSHQSSLTPARRLADRIRLSSSGY
jgi:hypothetical protein